MSRGFKIGLAVITAIIVVLVIAIIAFVLLFDPNDYRQKIGDEVKAATGRELLIDGDLGVSLFPWIAIDVGHAVLGNAQGFSEQPFASFQSAKLSVKLLPLLLHREITVGTASLDGLSVNLEVRQDGRGNWQDLVDNNSAESTPATQAAGPAQRLNVSGVSVSDATLHYSDQQSGARYTLTNLNFSSGTIAADKPVKLHGDFKFDAQPAAINGELNFDANVKFGLPTIELSDLSVKSTVSGLSATPFPIELKSGGLSIDTDKQLITFADGVELTAATVELTARIEPLSYANEITPVATLDIAAFSPRNLAQRLDIELPKMADPNALGRLSAKGKATVGAEAIALTGLTLSLDDTTLSGQLSVPLTDSGAWRFDLNADHIDLSAYMAPANDPSAAASDADTTPVAIPAELIRPLKAQGKLHIDKATLGKLELDDVAMGLNAGGGKLRLNPMSAKLYGGSYDGDIRVDVSGHTPVLSGDEQIKSVQLAPLAKAAFDKDNITGTINGTFKLSGQGTDLDAVQRTLSGTLAMNLQDGAYEGVDLWYELRRARALFRKEAPPDPVLPARTPFSDVKASGTVTDGVLHNDDFFAELPFMQLDGHGDVNIPAATIDYSMTARFLEKPEFAKQATAAELKDLTKAVIPLTVTGSLTKPKIQPDYQKLLQGAAQQKVKDKLLDLLGDDKSKDNPAKPGEQPKDKKPEDELKDRLRDLLKR